MSDDLGQSEFHLVLLLFSQLEKGIHAGMSTHAVLFENKKDVIYAFVYVILS